MDADLNPLRQAVDTLRASYGQELTRLQFEFTTEQLRTRIHIYASRVTAGAPASTDRAPTLELEATVVQP